MIVYHNVTYSTIIAKIAALDTSKSFFVQLGMLCALFSWESRPEWAIKYVFIDFELRKKMKILLLRNKWDLGI